MEEQARIIKNVTAKKVIAVFTDDPSSTTVFNEYDTNGDQRVLIVGYCSGEYPTLAFEGYDLEIMEQYMNVNNIPIPTP